MKVTWALLGLVILILLVLSPILLPKFYTNVGTVILNNALWHENQRADERQHSLRRASRLLRLASHEATGQNEDAASHSEGMIPSIIRAEYYRRLGNLKMAAAWLDRAALAESNPPLQKPLVFPATVQLSAEGAIVIDSSTPGWRVRRDSPVSAKVEQGSDNTTVFSWESESEQRKRGGFAWSNPFNIPYHHTIVLDIKIEQGCRFIFETVIDGKLVRHLRHSGSGQWEAVSTSVEGEHLTYLYAHLDGESEEQTRCQMEIRRISFVLDRSVVAASQS